MNKDHKLDVHEAVELLKAVCADYDLTTEWITPKMMTEQFRAAQGGSTPLDGEGHEVALSQEEFQTFCQTIMNFMSHLGSTTSSDTPWQPAGGVPFATPRRIAAAAGGAAAREIEVEDDQVPMATGKGGCGCFG